MPEKQDSGREGRGILMGKREGGAPEHRGKGELQSLTWVGEK